MDSQAPSTRPSKVRAVNVPQEMDLERLISGLHSRHESWSSDISACKWKGIKCNSEEKVTEIRWNRQKLSGSMKFAYLPMSIVELNIERNSISGELLPCDLFPLVNLSAFYLGVNKFTGNPDLTRLPKLSDAVWMERNELSGDICLTQLPVDLVHLDVSDNFLTGKLDLGALPRTLESLYLSGNEFEGMVDLSLLPENLDALALDNNALLEGTVVASELHPRLKKRIDVSNTKLVILR